MNSPISVLILSRNEEANIQECLRSVRWVDEVFVVDSGSQDHTVKIARTLGAKVVSHCFEGYAKQRNWALKNLPFTHEWMLMLDADERVPSALAKEIQAALELPQNAFDGYYLKRRFLFMGHWVRWGGLYPTWILRLFKRQRVQIEDRPLNEHAILNGRAGYLQNPFDHSDCRPLSEWITKHNRYADLEADGYAEETSKERYNDSIGVRFWGNQVERKRWVKLCVWNRLPLLLRPFLFFFRTYVLRGGFLDGKAGFIYHVLWSFWYQFLISAKIIERQGLSKSGGSCERTRLRPLDHLSGSTGKDVRTISTQ